MIKKALLILYILLFALAFIFPVIDTATGATPVKTDVEAPQDDMPNDTPVDEPEVTVEDTAEDKTEDTVPEEVVMEDDTGTSHDSQENEEQEDTGETMSDMLDSISRASQKQPMSEEDDGATETVVTDPIDDTKTVMTDPTDDTESVVSEPVDDTKMVVTDTTEDTQIEPEIHAITEATAKLPDHLRPVETVVETEETVSTEPDKETTVSTEEPIHDTISKASERVILEEFFVTEEKDDAPDITIVEKTEDETTDIIVVDKTEDDKTDVVIVDKTEDDKTDVVIVDKTEDETTDVVIVDKTEDTIDDQDVFEEEIEEYVMIPVEAVSDRTGDFVYSDNTKRPTNMIIFEEKSDHLPPSMRTDFEDREFTEMYPWYKEDDFIPETPDDFRRAEPAFVFKNDTIILPSLVVINADLGKQVFTKAYSLYSANDTEAALQLFIKLVHYNYRIADCYYYISWYHYLIKDYFQAVAYMEEAIVFSERNGIDSKKIADYTAQIGNIYYKLKEYAKAILYYSRSIEKNASFTDAYNKLGITYFSINNYEKALETWKKGADQGDLNCLSNYEWLRQQYRE